VIPDAADAIGPLLRRVVETGEPVVDLAFTSSTRRECAGIDRRLSPRARRIRVVTGVACSRWSNQGRGVERSAIHLAAREADRARVLRAVMKRLNEATTIPQVASAVVEDTMLALGAEAGFLAFVVRDATIARRRSKRCASPATRTR
jgi:hypothetical protein